MGFTILIELGCLLNIYSYSSIMTTQNLFSMLMDMTVNVFYVFNRLDLLLALLQSKYALATANRHAAVTI